MWPLRWELRRELKTFGLACGCAEVQRPGEDDGFPLQVGLELCGRLDQYPLMSAMVVFKTLKHSILFLWILANNSLVLRFLFYLFARTVSSFVMIKPFLMLLNFLCFWIQIKEQ